MRGLLWKIINIFLALFLAGIALSPYPSLKDYLWWSAIGVLAVGVINFFALKQDGRQPGGYVLLFLPALFAGSLLATAGAVSAAVFKIVLVVAGGLLWYLYQFYFPRPPRFVEDLLQLTTGFLLLVSIWSVSFFFALPSWIGMILILGLFFLFFWQVFYKLFRRPMPGSRPGGGVAAAALDGATVVRILICTLILTEGLWAVGFWPVYFLTAAVVNFAMLYLIYTLTTLYYDGRLTAGRVYFEVALMVIVLGASFLSSPWAFPR